MRAAIFGGEEGFDGGGSEPAKTWQELLDRLRADYERDYFLTGDVDVQLYAEDCEFSDPFAGFKGRDRFVRNLRNLTGGFISAYRVTMLDFAAEAEPVGGSEMKFVRSRLRVVLELALPWKPTLGWVWGVAHECQMQADGGSSQVWRCVAHRESWEIDPAEGVAMVFRPGKGLPMK